MKRIIFIFLALCVGNLYAQAPKPPYKSSKFEQLEQLLPTPNEFRTGDGSPGDAYWQQKADYKIKIMLDDKSQSLKGSETITYYNNSPQDLSYIWLQLDQNRFDKESDTYKSQTFDLSERVTYSMVSWVAGINSEGGYSISNVKDAKGKALNFTINKTMMRIELPEPLKAKGGTFTFSLDWAHKIMDANKMGARGGYEYFADSDNYLYEIAQWFPRMAVYDDVNGWQNKQFLGNGEFALTFGDYDVEITVPEDHVVAATGELQNPDDVLNATQKKRWNQAKTSKTPVLIVTQEEAVAKEKTKATKTKTWKYKAQNVRDFAWASSRKFIWDAMQVDVEGKKVWAMSYFPKEGNPLWGEFSTNVVALTLKVYSKYTFAYPYPVAISVHGPVFGMEYPMICFNGGRPRPDGTVPDGTRRAMASVIIHEVGHNFFPMIVNSDERQWTWMDEGINSFLQYLTEKEISDQEWAQKYYPKGSVYPSRRGPAKNIVRYMRSDPSQIVPIMNNSESIPQFGNNAYGKPATALNILRETVMGQELFDYAFKQYSRRWMFKHPMPADFFRTMEDASAVDLDWFWRGWFYTTDACDISIESVDLFRFPDAGASDNELIKSKKFSYESSDYLIKRIEDNAGKLSDAEKSSLSSDKYFYKVKFKNIGGLVMPVILHMKFKDGSEDLVRLPAEIWRMDPVEINKVFITDKEVTGFVLDPYEETADIDTENNTYPREGTQDSKFKEFKEKQENK